MYLQGCSIYALKYISILFALRFRTWWKAFIHFARISKSSTAKHETYLRVSGMQICIYGRAFQQQSKHALSHGDKHPPSGLNESSTRLKASQKTAESEKLRRLPGIRIPPWFGCRRGARETQWDTSPPRRGPARPALLPCHQTTHLPSAAQQDCSPRAHALLLVPTWKYPALLPWSAVIHPGTARCLAECWANGPSSGTAAPKPTIKETEVNLQNITLVLMQVCVYLSTSLFIFA